MIGQFLGGDPRRAPDVAGLVDRTGDRQAFRLARLLRAYEEHLPAEELALLCRLCVLRRSATAAQIGELFLCTPAVHARAVREIPLIVRAFQPLIERIGSERALELSQAIEATVEEALVAAPLAGPRDAFNDGIGDALRQCDAIFGGEQDVDLAELAHLYRISELQAPTEHLPLAADDRRQPAAKDRRLSRSARSSFQPLRREERDGGCFSEDRAQEISPHRLSGVRPRRRARRAQAGEAAVCGSLPASTTPSAASARCAGWRSESGRLPGRWRRSMPPGWSGFSMPSAIGISCCANRTRASACIPPCADHFYRLASAQGGGQAHDRIREQLVSLARQPGKRLPDDAPTLGLVEEAIYHTLQAGRAEEAWNLFNEGLGGLRHMAWKLGEMARGLRILRSFEPCPDPWSLAWFLRALANSKMPIEIMAFRTSALTFACCRADCPRWRARETMTARRWPPS